MLTWLAPVMGALLLLVLMRDVYSTVFVPHGRAGPLMHRIYARVWAVARAGVARLPKPKARSALSSIGPLLVGATFVVWGALLILGYALIYYPWAERFAPPDVVATMPRWAIALYYSGYAATTLGVGDVYPPMASLRLVAVLEAAQGFALFSVSVTYLLSVYGALSASDALALEITRFMDGRAVPPAISTLVAAGRAGEQGLERWLEGILPRLSGIIVAQGQYPLLHYFHSPDDDRAFPVAIGYVLETTTLARTLLSPDGFPGLTGGTATRAAFDAARQAVHATLDSVNAGPRDEGGREERERHRAFERAYRELRSAGVPLRAKDEARLRYVECRSTWDAALAGMRGWFSYPMEP